MISESGRTLTFSDPQSHGVGPADFLSVTVAGPDMRAIRLVYAGGESGFAHLAEYFAGLATDWRGWSGRRTFESVEGDLRIDATHDGHVNLSVRLRESAVPDGWLVETAVRLDAGESLSRAARDLHGLVHLPVSDADPGD